jgi:hypothetical protein
MAFCTFYANSQKKVEDFVKKNIFLFGKIKKISTFVLF